MRTVIYNYIKDLKLRNYILVDGLPWEGNGTPLYLNNKKHIFIETAQTSQSPVFDTLDNKAGAVDEVITVSVFFVNDAKKLPLDYDSTIELLKGARTAVGTERYSQKLCQVTSSFQEDAIVTKLEFSFRKLLTN
jgi:hypothetical protein